MNKDVTFSVVRLVDGAVKCAIPNNLSSDNADVVRSFVDSFSFLLNRPGYAGRSVPLAALADLADAYSSHPRTQYSTAVIRELCC